MSERMSINVDIPGLNSMYNFMVPGDMSISKVTELLIKIMKDEYPDAAVSLKAPHALIQESTGKVLLNNAGLNQMGIVNGEKLLLI